MLAHRIPSEAELQPDLDVGAALGVELLSTPEVVVREASLAAGRLRGLAAGSTEGGLCDVDLRSDLADSQARAGQVENLLLVRRTGRTTDRVSDVAGLRGLARFYRRRYARCARLRRHLTHDEALTEGAGVASCSD